MSTCIIWQIWYCWEVDLFFFFAFPHNMLVHLCTSQDFPSFSSVFPKRFEKDYSKAWMAALWAGKSVFSWSCPAAILPVPAYGHFLPHHWGDFCLKQKTIFKLCGFFLIINYIKVILLLFLSVFQQVVHLNIAEDCMNKFKSNIEKLCKVEQVCESLMQPTLLGLSKCRVMLETQVATCLWVTSRSSSTTSWSLKWHFFCWDKTMVSNPERSVQSCH